MIKSTCALQDVEKRKSVTIGASCPGVSSSVPVPVPVPMPVPFARARARACVRARALGKSVHGRVSICRARDVRVCAMLLRRANPRLRLLQLRNRLTKQTRHVVRSKWV